MDLNLSVQSDDAAASALIVSSTVSGSIDSTIVVGASLSNAISDIVYIAGSFNVAVIVFVANVGAVGVNVEVYDLNMQIEGSGVTHPDGFVSVAGPPDGYVVIALDGYVVQKHRYTSLDSYVLLQLSLVPIVSVIHTPRGHFVSAAPQDGANNIFL